MSKFQRFVIFEPKIISQYLKPFLTYLVYMSYMENDLQPRKNYVSDEGVIKAGI